MIIAILRKLGDPSPQVRMKALLSLSRKKLYLEFNEDVAKLFFESFFRVFWLADTKHQRETIDGIVGFLRLLKFSPKKSSYIFHFWTVFDKNWPGIDRFRLNKFYSLVDAVFSNIVDSTDDLSNTYEFILNKCSQKSQRPSGLIIHIVFLLEQRLDEKSVDFSVINGLCFFFLNFMAQCPGLTSCPSAAEQIRRLLAQSPAKLDVKPIFESIDGLLRSNSLPKGSRRLLTSILDKEVSSC
jgi:hypothetical protein